ncbi:hypothetical protein CCMA1212_006104 [Trichoderma ghanense]|uniref:DUF5071 domain-containing protein n=1 Tax=Trichoderma ghanense TaxID=65468 RepID=A0ABY2H2J0_9HYPO
MPDSQMQQIESQSLDEAIGSGSLEQVLHWIGTGESQCVYTASSAADEDGGSPVARQLSTTSTRDILIARADDPVIVQGISSVLSKPIASSDDFFTACAGLDSILCHLPLDTLRLYRSSLEILAANTAQSPPGVSLPSLTSRAKDALEFINSPDLAWPPRHKFDVMAERTLAERVRTADQMRPHARRLLDWLADCNWPPYSGCVKQLARFPEVAIDPIKNILAEHGDDPEWLRHLVEFVEGNVRIGTLWERLEPELVLLAGREADEEESRDLAEACRRLLGLLKEWRGEQLVLD